MAHSRQDDCVEGDREHGDDPSEPSEAHADIDQYLPSTHDALDTIATISLHYPDCIRLLCFPDEIIDLIRDTITKHWPEGITKEGDQARALEFKLKNYPWSRTASSATILRHLLEALYNRRWKLLTATALSRSPIVLDQLFFEYQASQPAPQHWTSIQFVGYDTLWVYDAPSDLLHILVAALSGDTAKHGPAKRSTAGTYEFKLKGAPWSGRPKDHTAASLHVMTLLRTLRRNGFEMYANIDAMLQMRKEHAQRWQDTWIVTRSQQWDPSQSPDFQ